MATSVFAFNAQQVQAEMAFWEKASSADAEAAHALGDELLLRIAQYLLSDHSASLPLTDHAAIETAIASYKRMKKWYA
jgi:hypothetical protein